MNETPSLHLIPAKIILHGPPASGKTKLAMRICQKYGAHYVNIKTMINETLEDLVSMKKIFTSPMSKIILVLGNSIVNGYLCIKNH